MKHRYYFPSFLSVQTTLQTDFGITDPAQPESKDSSKSQLKSICQESPNGTCCLVNIQTAQPTSLSAILIRINTVFTQTVKIDLTVKQRTSSTTESSRAATGDEQARLQPAVNQAGGKHVRLQVVPAPSD